MKKFILAAAAVLRLGVGSAFAAQTVTNQSGQPMFGHVTLTRSERSRLAALAAQIL